MSKRGQSAVKEFHLNRVVKKGFTENEAFEQSPKGNEDSNVFIWRNSIPGRSGKCKVQEMGIYLEYLM